MNFHIRELLSPTDVQHFGWHDNVLQADAFVYTFSEIGKRTMEDSFPSDFITHRITICVRDRAVNVVVWQFDVP